MLFKPKLKLAFYSLVSNLLPQFVVPLVSFWIITNHDIKLWGQFVFPLIMIQLYSQFLSFGHREFLFREFANNPISIKSIWQENFMSRGLFLVPLIVSLVIIFPNYALLLSVWLIANHFINAFQSLVTYDRIYLPTILMETIILSVTMLIGAYLDVYSVESLVKLFTYYSISRAFFFSIIFRNYWQNFKFKWKATPIKKMWPYFLPIMIGLLQKRLELHFSVAFLSKEDLGIFQILTNFLSYHMTFTSLIVLPFTKNFFRMRVSALGNIEWRAQKFSLPFCLLTAVVIGLIMDFGYHVSFGLWEYCLTSLYLFPYLGYLIGMYILIRADRMIDLAKCFGYATIPSVLLAIILMPKYGWHGALISATVSQYVLWILVRRETKKNTNS